MSDDAEKPAPAAGEPLSVPARETPPDVGIVWQPDGKVRVLTKSTSKSEVLGVLVCAICELDAETGELVVQAMAARQEAVRRLRNQVVQKRITVPGPMRRDTDA